jgi:hypothetical protein
MKMPFLALFATPMLAFPLPHAGVPLRPAPVTVRYIVAPTGNEARYRVREQLMHHDLLNDAVGKTTAITGSVVVDPS